MLQQLARLAWVERPPGDLASYRKRAESLLLQLQVADKMLTAASAPGDTLYSKYKRPIDAIEAYLNEKGNSASREEIIQAVIEGGFQKGRPGLDWKIGRSFDAFLGGRGKANSNIKELNGLIGLKDWDKSRFK